MSATSGSNLAAHLSASAESKLRSLTTVAMDAMTQHSKGHIMAHTRDFAVENCLIKGAAAFENFLEELFENALLGNIASGPPRMRANDRDEVNLLLRRSAAPESFLDWLPYDQTLARANRYLFEDHPFRWITFRSDELNSLREVTVVRNFAAHESGSAAVKFTDILRSRRHRPEMTAGEFLSASAGGTPEIHAMLSHLTNIVVALGRPDEGSVFREQILIEPADYLAHKDAPVGKYQCVLCGATLTLNVVGKIAQCGCQKSSACPSCGKRTQPPPSRWRRLA